MFRRASAGLAVAAHLGAQENDPRAVQPERPTVATHAHTVAPGYMELEAGVQGDRLDRDSRAYGAPLVWKVGLASHVQLNVTTPAVFSAPARSSGAGDVSVGLKWRLLDRHAVLGDFALLPSVKLATGSVARGTGSGTTDVGIMAISSYTFGPVAMDLNAGYTRVGSANGATASDAALWTASFGFPVAGRLSWVAEAFGSPTIDGTDTRSTVAVLTGPTFLVSTALNLDLGVITPVRGDMPNAIYAGFVWNLGRFPFVSGSAARYSR
ncbi:MAG: transporter [Gemmatimonadaceae bacterium]